MTVESSYAIAMATLSDWLKDLAPVFQPMRSKAKTNRTLHARFFPRFEQVTGNGFQLLVHRAVCSLSDWSERLLWYRFFDSHLKTAQIEGIENTARCTLKLKVMNSKVCRPEKSLAVRERTAFFPSLPRVSSPWFAQVTILRIKDLKLGLFPRFTSGYIHEFW